MAAQLSDNIGNIIADKISDASPIAVFTMVAYAIQTKHHKFVHGISPSEDTIYNGEIEIDENIDNDKNMVILNEIAKELRVKSDIDSLANFAKLKYFLDKFFYQITIQGILEYSYKAEYMLPNKDLREALSISRTTVSRYKDLGMEYVEGYGHKTYPAHNIFYWSNPLWSSRIQSLYQSYKIRNRTELDVIVELMDEIQKYEEQYGGTFEVVFKDIIDGTMDIYDLDEPDDYKDWKDLLEELQEIKGVK